MAYEVRLGVDTMFFSFVNSAHALVETDLCSEYACWKLRWETGERKMTETHKGSSVSDRWAGGPSGAGSTQMSWD